MDHADFEDLDELLDGADIVDLAENLDREDLAILVNLDLPYLECVAFNAPAQIARFLISFW